MRRPEVAAAVGIVVIQVPGLSGEDQLAAAGAGNDARRHLRREPLSERVVVGAVAAKVAARLFGPLPPRHADFSASGREMVLRRYPCVAASEC